MGDFIDKKNTILQTLRIEVQFFNSKQSFLTFFFMKMCLQKKMCLGTWFPVPSISAPMLIGLKIANGNYLNVEESLIGSKKVGWWL